jgi:NAD(P)-dependent dehydrogenase (short-subunit alcohol dehydrogenase family)
MLDSHDPDASSTSQRPTASAVASVLAVGELADELLPDGAGASLTFVLPAWGVIATEKQAAAELAASAARALMQCNLENWAARNRRINIIRVGAADDALFTSTRKLDDLVARTPMHRAATSDEIADAIDFLASEAAGYVTGSVLEVDGGWSAYSWFFPARDL